MFDRLKYSTYKSCWRSNGCSDGLSTHLRCSFATSSIIVKACISAWHKPNSLDLEYCFFTTLTLGYTDSIGPRHTRSDILHSVVVYRRLTSSWQQNHEVRARVNASCNREDWPLMRQAFFLQTEAVHESVCLPATKVG